MFKVLWIQFFFLFLIFTIRSGSGFSAELQFDGFFTTGYAHSSNRNFTFDDVSNAHNFTRLTKFGLNAVANLNENLDFHSQITAAINGRSGSKFSLELAKLSWRPTNQFSLHLGLHKMPTWLISDYQNVGVLYPWVRLPVEVYGVVPLTSFAGLELEYELPLIDSWMANLNIFGGGFSFATQGVRTSFENTQDAKIFGVVASVTNRQFTLRTSYSQTVLKATALTTVDSPSADLLGATARHELVSDFNLGRTHFLSASAKMDAFNVFLLSEYAMLSSKNSLFKYTNAIFGAAGYYFWNRKILPVFTLAKVFKTTSTMYPGGQNSYTGTLNFWATPSVVTKAEYQYITVKDGDTGRFETAPGKNVHVISSSMSLVF